MENDIIYRRDAINAMIKDKILKGVPLITNTAERDFEVFNSACDRHAKIIEGLPSAQPEDRCSECDAWNKYIHYSSALQERKKGTWRHYEGMLTCSVCGAEFYDDIMEYFGNDVPRFCPDCGSDMRGEDHAD